jgi:hypothetical protein
MTLPDLRKLTQLTRMPGRQLISSALLGGPKRVSIAIAISRWRDAHRRHLDRPECHRH